MQNKTETTQTWEKIEFYIISLWLLFFLIIIVTIEIPVCFGCDCYFIGFESFFALNIIPCISMLLLLIGFFFYRRLEYKLSGSVRNPVKVTEVENINYEHLTFLTTYIIPLICFDLSQPRYATVMLVLLVIIGAIYIKTNLFYANPSLALLGYHIYSAKGKFKGSQSPQVILISRDKIYNNDSVHYIKLDSKIFYTRKSK